MDSDQAKLQRKIVKQWQAIASQFPEAYNDLMAYIDSQREMYRKYGEEMAMPHPTGDGQVSISLETCAILLQNGRGMNIVKTYIESRVSPPDVAQPKKTK